MPRTPLEPRFQVDYLSILDAEGNLDTSLEPKLPAAELKRLYRAMLLGRRLDERMVRLQRQGRIGTFAPIKGQEASQLGSVCTLKPTDWMVPSFRETAAMIWRGWPIEKMLMFFAANTAWSRTIVRRAIFKPPSTRRSTSSRLPTKRSSSFSMRVRYTRKLQRVSSSNPSFLFNRTFAIRRRVRDGGISAQACFE